MNSLETTKMAFAMKIPITKINKKWSRGNKMLKIGNLESITLSRRDIYIFNMYT